MQDDIVLMYIMLSDMAVREAGTGKVSFIGSFHQYQSAVFPMVAPAFVVTPFLTNIRGKIEKPITIAMRIEDPKTGFILANAIGNMGIVPGYEFRGTEVIDVPFPIPQVVIQSPGMYQVSVMVDGEKLGHRALPVHSLTPMSQPPKE